MMNVHTWRRIVLASLIVADKVFEDYAVWNADFLSLFPQTDIQDLNTLEREFLNFLQYATTFKASDYAKYYFALKELSDNKDILPAKPLSQEQATMCCVVCEFIADVGLSFRPTDSSQEA